MHVAALCVTWACAASAAPPPADLRHVEAFLAGADYGLRKRYRPSYHLTAPYGWLNNPAAFVFFKRKYHVFYQYHPYEGAWGAMHWGHAVSDDLAAWAHYPPALVPRDPYDRYGCFAGSTVLHNGYLAVFYVGHVTLGNHTHNTLDVAISADGIVFQKYLYNPVLRGGPGRFAEFRNPKVWRYRDTWYMLAASSIARRGHLLLYASPDLYNWRLNGSVAQSHGDMGHTWDSPDLFELDGLGVLVLSAHGLRSDGTKFRNFYQTGYVVGRFDLAARFDDLEVSTATFYELDFGHDFYAAKTCQAPDGRRLLVAWLGGWEGEFPEAQDGWAGLTTLVREVRFGREGRLATPPVREVTTLRDELLEDAVYNPGEEFRAGTKTFELLVNASSTAQDAVVSLRWGDEGHYTVVYWAERGEIAVDMSGADGLRRADWRPRDNLNLRIFVDKSSVEVYCGEGDVVFSSRIYPKRALYVKIAGSVPLHITQYRLKLSVGYDAKLLEHLKNIVLAKRN